MEEVKTTLNEPVDPNMWRITALGGARVLMWAVKKCLIVMHKAKAARGRGLQRDTGFNGYDKMAVCGPAVTPLDVYD